MTDLQAIVTGVLIGALLRVKDKLVRIDIEPMTDGAGNYLPQFLVRGRESGEHLVVQIDVVKR